MKSLNGVAGFRDYEMPLETNKNYDFSHTPGTAAYEYKGWEKSTVGTPTGSNIEQGDPYSLSPYTGGFDYHINYYYKTDETPPPDPVGKCTVPQPANEITGSVMDPDVSGVIKADSRGSERFNVLDGIPTSESLYGNVLAKTYLYKDKFVQMTGTCTYEVVVNREYTLKWDPKKKETGPDGKEKEVPDPQEETETLTQTHTIERPYSFWTIDNLEVYKIDQAKLWNYAFDAGGIQLQPTGYNAPYYAASKSSSYTPPESPGTVDAPPGSKSGGKERPDISGENLKSFAEAAIDPVKVKNDTLTFNGQTIMNGAEASQSGPTPGQIPSPAQIGNNVLYSPGNVVPTSKTNKANQASTGTIYYGLMSGNINGGSDQSYPIHGINSVTVHTPVVIYPAVSDDKAHNQKTKPAAGKSAIILDRPFTVEMPNSGQHTNYQGYGNRNYLKYIGSKQVRFPFDVYSANKSIFYPKNTWIEVDKTKESFVFFLPVWVDEGFYSVEFRTIAHNAPSGATQQENANLNLVNHIAYDTVPVDAIGRVYDFRITDIADYNWEQVFRKQKGSTVPTNASYWVGPNGIDGQPNGSAFPYELPIRRGSHPNSQYKNVAVKTGYHLKFDLKTKGNMFGSYDSLRISPTFYFVDLSGKRQPVDLYYHSEKQKFIKIGSAVDVQKRYVTLDSRLRNVSQATIKNTAESTYDLFAASSGWNLSKGSYITQYLASAKKPTYIGGYDVELITSGLRTFIGGRDVPNGVSAARKEAAVQQWYGEYSLPAETYVVAKGTNLAEYGRTHRLDEKSSIFLKKGFIIVNFDIETIQNKNLDQPHLQYIHTGLPEANQWKREGFKYQLKDPYGLEVRLYDGDVVFYHADKSSADDFGSSGTH
ncbi:DUF5704 domain-containing protein [Paenibacillus vini]|uniref:DUF5704 domain-containing protein n=1 Tax=Paenibacillus vini TaxID=1476024 RepID=UPI0025B68668|nr:DUF5704 domain-containing protein [Paenibacillus vini]MDN4071369.1 DUF5704 domain-containing protein [Paenibacillus vini]